MRLLPICRRLHTTRFPWGRALGREILDGLLLQQARDAGAAVFQPWAVRRISGQAGQWQCELRAVETSAMLSLHARGGDRRPWFVGRPAGRSPAAPAGPQRVPICWHSRPISEARRLPRARSACWPGWRLRWHGGGRWRRDDPGLLHPPRPPGRAARSRAGRNVPATRSKPGCSTHNNGVRRALQGAERDGPWLSSGPLDPGIRISASDTDLPGRQCGRRSPSDPRRRHEHGAAIGRTAVRTSDRAGRACPMPRDRRRSSSAMQPTGAAHSRRGCGWPRCLPMPRCGPASHRR